MTPYHASSQTNQTNQLQSTTGRAATSTTRKASRSSFLCSDRPEHASPSQQRCASQPPPIYNTPSSPTAIPSVPVSPGTSPIPDTPSSPTMDTSAPSGPGTPTAQPKKPALALRRLQDCNAKGLLKQ